MRLIHITDPHLSTLEHLSLGQVRGKRLSGFLSWQKNRRHHHLPGVLEQLRLAVLAEKPEQILLTGDLVQIGTEEEVRASRMWLERKCGSLHVIHGSLCAIRFRSSGT